MEMTIQVTREDLIHMIKGSTPSFNIMNDEIISRLGRFIGGWTDEWHWGYTFPNDITDEQLWQTYQLIKKSK